ncbi:MAG: amino acid ABC transporter permease [Anaerolineaceae bacterium]|nr:amino acid ABC transporter permease [Anaerolineaceae bacterium]
MIEEQRFHRAEELPPPDERPGLLGWLRRNLFNNWYNALQTVVAAWFLFVLFRLVVVWLVEQAQWGVVTDNVRIFMTGQYPQEQLFRIWLCLHLLAVLIGLTWGIWVRAHRLAAALILLLPILLAVFSPEADSRVHLLVWVGVALVAFILGRLGGASLRRVTIAGWVLYFPLVLLIIRGVSTQDGWLPVVSSNLWGGLLLTFLLTIVGILFSFPIGLLLALGRRSELPVVRWFSVAYIEVIRGVPLITILFMASTMVPLFLPLGVTIDRVLRAMVGIVIFSSAYLAENVRGGLQAIPRGQYEAAHAIGLSSVQTMTLIILPQALRLVIPVLVGQFIALFKDTSLVATIGLLDLLGIARSILANPRYISYQHEVLVFITLIYWGISFLMSLFSQRLEAALGVGQR